MVSALPSVVSPVLHALLLLPPARLPSARRFCDPSAFTDPAELREPLETAALEYLVEGTSPTGYLAERYLQPEKDGHRRLRLHVLTLYLTAVYFVGGVLRAAPTRPLPRTRLSP